MDSNNGWAFTYAAYYIVSPKKGKNDTLFSPEVKGNEIPINILPSIIKTFFWKDPDSYPVGIVFRSTSGEKRNHVRDDIKTLATGTKEEQNTVSLKIAQRLCHSMDLKSHRGLMVILCGKKQDFSRVIIWKFPQEIILHPTETSVTQIDEAYATEFGYVKAAVFEDKDSKEAFWKGRVEDKENVSIIKQAADFWINDFLLSQTEITDNMGTRMLSGLVREAIDKSSSLDEKNQIITSFRAFENRAIAETSISEFVETFLPPNIAKKFEQKISEDNNMQSRFKLVPSEADKIIGYESYELDNGLLITGPYEVLDKFVSFEADDQITITGKIRNKRLRSIVK